MYPRSWLATSALECDSEHFAHGSDTVLCRPSPSFTSFGTKVRSRLHVPQKRGSYKCLECDSEALAQGSDTDAVLGSPLRTFFGTKVKGVGLHVPPEACELQSENAILSTLAQGSDRLGYVTASPSFTFFGTKVKE